MERKRFLKRVLSLLLAFVMIFSFWPLREHFSKAGKTEIPKYKLLSNGELSIYTIGNYFVGPVKVRPKGVNDNSEDFHSYCIDVHILPILDKEKYSARDWTQLRKELYGGKFGKLKAVVMNSYPHLSVSDVRKTSSMNYLSKDAIMAATQIFLWHQIHGGDIRYVKRAYDPSENYDPTLYDQWEVRLTYPGYSTEDLLKKKSIKGTLVPVRFLVRKDQEPNYGDIRDAETGLELEFANFYEYLRRLAPVAPIPALPKATIDYSASEVSVLDDGSLRWSFVAAVNGVNADKSAIKFQRFYEMEDGSGGMLPVPGTESISGNKITFTIPKDQAQAYYGKRISVRSVGIQELVKDYLPLYYDEGHAAGQTMIATDPISLYEEVTSGYGTDLPKEPTVSMTVTKTWGAKALKANKQFDVEMEFLKETPQGDVKVHSVTLNQGNGWTQTVQLPKIELGQLIVYKIHESGESGGKIVNGADSFDVSYDTVNNTVTNEYVEPAPPMKTIRIEKKWGAKAVQDGKQFPVSVQLLRVNGSDTELVDTVDLSEANGWATEKEVVKSENGTDIVYKVQEIGENKGKLIRGRDEYEVRYSGESIVTNEYIGVTPLPSKDVVITKKWGKDAEKHGKKIPVSVQLIQLKGTQETPVQTLELKEENQWTSTVNVPAEDNGIALTYKIKEVGEDGGNLKNGEDQYSVSYKDTTVTNEYMVPAIEMIDITVKKTWGPNAQAHGKKIAVEVEILKMKGSNSEVVKKVTLNEKKNWQEIVTLPKKDGNQEIRYTIREVNESGGTLTVGEDVYEVKYSGSEIHNEYVVPMMDIEVQKQWGPEALAAGKTFPVVIDVIQNGGSGHIAASVELNEGNGWRKIVQVPKKIGNEAVTYHLHEQGEDKNKLKRGTDDYTVVYNGEIVINEYVKPTPPVEMKEFRIMKEWGAKALQHNKKIPVSLKLLKNDGSAETEVEILSLTEADGFSKTMNLAVKENGKAYTYRIMEVNEVGGVLKNGKDEYDVEYQVQNDELKVINEYREPAPEKVSITITKEWGAEAKKAKKEIPVRVELLRRIGTQDALLETFDLNEGNGWMTTVEKNKKDAVTGEDIVYVIKEVDEVNGKMTVGADEYLVTYDGYKVTNEYVVPAPKTRDIVLEKEWGAEAKKAKKEFEVQVELWMRTAGGDQKVLDRRLNATEGWKATVNVQKENAGTDIEYFIKEVGEVNNIVKNGADEYTVSYDGFKVINEYKPLPPVKHIDILLEKVWGAEAKKAKKEFDVQVELWKRTVGGDEKVLDRILNAANGWTETVTVEKENAGTDIDYFIKEVGEANGVLKRGADEYIVTYDGFKVINEYKPLPPVKFTEITLQKEWGANATAHNKQVEVSFQLLKSDGSSEMPTEIIKLNDGNGWMKKLNVVTEENGKKYTYRIVEIGEVGNKMTIGTDEYQVSYDGFKVVNEYIIPTPDMLDIVIIKEWGSDAYQHNKLIPVSVELYKRTGAGDQLVHTVNLDDTNHWTETVQVLKYENGLAIEYFVREIGEANERMLNGADIYKVRYEGFKVVNEYMVPAPPKPPAPDMMDITVSKQWGNEAQNHNKQFALNVELLKETTTGEELVQVFQLNETDGWTKTLNVPKSENGQDIVYRVREVGESNGKLMNGTDEYRVEYRGFEIVNEYVVPAPPLKFMEITLEKEWGPNALANNKQVEVSFQLLKSDGSSETPTEIIVLNDGNGWRKTLNVITEENGKSFSYRVIEIGEVGNKMTIGSDEYQVSYQGYKVLNEYVDPGQPTPDMRDIMIMKKWGPEATKANKEFAVRVELLEDNGASYDHVLFVDLSVANNWMESVTVPKSRGGQDILYVIREEGELNGTVMNGADEYEVSYAEFTVVNEYKVPTPPTPPTPPAPGTVDITVQKRWGTQAETHNKKFSVNVELLKETTNGQQLVEAFELNESGAWSKTLSVPKSENGQDIIYRVREIGESGGKLMNGADEYTVEYRGFEIFNEYTVPTPPTPDTVEITVEKEWGVEAVKAAKEFPVMIEITKRVAGVEAIVRMIQLDGSNGWRETLHLPKSENGETIVYSIKEIGEFAGKITNNGDEYTVRYDGYRVMNEYVIPKPPVEFMSITLLKEWGALAQTLNKQIAVSFQVLRNDGSSEMVYEVVELNGSEGWMKKMNVVKAENGKTYTYRVLEVGEVNGKMTYGTDEYAVSYDGYRVVNEYVPTVTPPTPPTPPTPNPPVPDDPAPYDPTPLDPPEEEPYQPNPTPTPNPSPAPNPTDPPTPPVPAPNPTDPPIPNPDMPGGENPPRLPETVNDGTDIGGEDVPLSNPDLSLNADQHASTDDAGKHTGEKRDPFAPKESAEASGDTDKLTDDETPLGLPKAGQVGLLTVFIGAIVLAVGVLLKKKNSTR